MPTESEKKVEVFLFCCLKRHLNGISDRTVQRCFLNNKTALMSAMPTKKALNQSCILTPAIATRIASVFPNRKDFVRMFHAHRGFEMSNDIS